MKKLFIEFMIVFAVFLGLRWILTFFRNGQVITYPIEDGKKTYYVTEDYTRKQKHNDDAYTFVIKEGKDVFSFQTTASFRGAQNVIVSLQNYQDGNIRCILPIYKGNQILSDLLCKEGEQQIYYHQLVGKYKKLDQFVSSLKNYRKRDFTDDKKNGIHKNMITFYPNQRLEDVGIAMNDYRGSMIFQENDVETYQLFQNDVYDQKLSIMTDHYYLVADYEQPFEIDRFYLLDLRSGKKEALETKYMISKDSYIQGVVDRCVYIYDRSNQKQYEIDLIDKRILEVGNGSIHLKYYDGKNWETKPIYEATSDFYFESYPNVTKQFSGFDKVIQVGGDLTGYYYFYQKDETGYRVYRAPVKHKTAITYLFHTTSLESILYFDGFVYFVEHNDVKCFHETIGIKTIATNSEFEFNPTLHFGVFEN